MTETPRNGNTITREWLEVIMRDYEAKSGQGRRIDVTSFQTGPGANPGEYFASQVVKVLVEALVTSRKIKRTCNDEEKEEAGREENENEDGTETTRAIVEEDEQGSNGEDTTTSQSTMATVRNVYNFVAKFMVSDTWDREYNKFYRNHLKEVLIYSSVLPALNQYQATITGNKYPLQLPELLHDHCSGDEFALVMDDIRCRGYRTLGSKDTLNLGHVLMAAGHLARVHAVSYAFDKTHNFLEKYPDFITDVGMVRQYTTQMSVVYDGLIQALQHKEGRLPELLETMVANKSTVLEKFERLYHKDSEKWLECLTHGDAWVPNLMYREKDTEINKDTQSADEISSNMKMPEDLIIIDWQDVAWRNPIFDLQELVFRCTTRDFRETYLEEVQVKYFTTFMAGLDDLGEGLGNFTFEDFLKEWRRTIVVGTMSGFAHALSILSDSNAGKQNENAQPFQHDSSNRQGCVQNNLQLSQKNNESINSSSPHDHQNQEPPGILSMVKASVLRQVVLPLLEKPVSQFLVRSWAQRSYQSNIQELISGHNTLLTTRVFDLLEEAHKNGVFLE